MARAAVFVREGARVLRADSSGREKETVAELACFLASDRTPFLPGTVTSVDGGLTATNALSNQRPGATT